MNALLNDCCRTTEQQNSDYENHDQSHRTNDGGRHDADPRVGHFECQSNK
jgi:hypothetical protein